MLPLFLETATPPLLALGLLAPVELAVFVVVLVVVLVLVEVSELFEANRVARVLGDRQAAVIGGVAGAITGSGRRTACWCWFWSRSCPRQSCCRCPSRRLVLPVLARRAESSPRWVLPLVDVLVEVSVLLEAMVLVLSEPTAVVLPLTVLPEAVLLPPLLADGLLAPVELAVLVLVVVVVGGIVVVLVLLDPRAVVLPLALTAVPPLLA